MTFRFDNYLNIDKTFFLFYFLKLDTPRCELKDNEIVICMQKSSRMTQASGRNSIAPARCLQGCCFNQPTVHSGLKPACPDNNNDRWLDRERALPSLGHCRLLMPLAVCPTACLTRSLQWGLDVCALLRVSAVWPSYKVSALCVCVFPLPAPCFDTGWIAPFESRVC